MLFLVSVRTFNGKKSEPPTPDSQGYMPVYLDSFNGELPERSATIAGTVAKNAGLEVGNTYLLKITKTSVDPVYGPRYSYSTLGGAVDPLDAAERLKTMDKGHCVDLTVKAKETVLDPSVVTEVSKF
mgnify:CR=1 FL=1